MQEKTFWGLVAEKAESAVPPEPQITQPHLGCLFGRLSRAGDPGITGGGPLWGPESGLLSNTQKCTV